MVIKGVPRLPQGNVTLWDHISNISLLKRQGVGFLQYDSNGV